MTDEGDVGGPVDRRDRLADELIGQHDRRRLQRLGKMNGPLCGEQAIGNGLRGQHEVWRIAMEAVDGDVEIGLFGFGRDARGRAGAHHVNDDDRNLGGGSQAERFDH